MSKALLSSMKWRRSLKCFSPNTKDIDITPILQAACLAPTSFGIQPFQIYIVTTAEMKTKLAPACYNQPQITSCSHLLIFAARNDASNTVDRCISAHKFDTVAPGYSQTLRQSLSSMDSNSFLQWSINQAHIALAYSLVAAGDLQIGTCPMGGFDADALGLLLNLPENEKVAVLLAIGTAPVDDNDEKANPFPKYRMVLDDIVIVLDKPLQVVAAPIEAPKLIFPPIV